AKTARCTYFSPPASFACRFNVLSKSAHCRINFLYSLAAACSCVSKERLPFLFHQGRKFSLKYWMAVTSSYPIVKKRCTDLAPTCPNENSVCRDNDFPRYAADPDDSCLSCPDTDCLTFLPDGTATYK